MTFEAPEIVTVDGLAETGLSDMMARVEFALTRRLVFAALLSVPVQGERSESELQSSAKEAHTAAMVALATWDALDGRDG